MSPIDPYSCYFLRQGAISLKKSDDLFEDVCGEGSSLASIESREELDFITGN